MEIEITLAVIAIEIVVLRWIVLRMPILGDSPAWVHEEEKLEQSYKEQPVTEDEMTWKA